MPDSDLINVDSYTQHPFSPRFPPAPRCVYGSASDYLHLGVGVNGHHVVALRRLHPSLGVGLAVQIVLDEEVASLLEVDTAVVAHETLGVVQLVPRLHDGAAGWREAGGTKRSSHSLNNFKIKKSHRLQEGCSVSVIRLHSRKLNPELLFCNGGSLTNSQRASAMN